MKKLPTVVGSRPSCLAIVTCISFDGLFVSWKKSVGRTTSVNNNNNNNNSNMRGHETNFWDPIREKAKEIAYNLKLFLKLSSKIDRVVNNSIIFEYYFHRTAIRYD